MKILLEFDILGVIVHCSQLLAHAIINYKTVPPNVLSRLMNK